MKDGKTKVVSEAARQFEIGEYTLKINNSGRLGVHGPTVYAYGHGVTVNNHDNSVSLEVRSDGDSPYHTNIRIPDMHGAEGHDLFVWICKFMDSRKINYKDFR